MPTIDPESMRSFSENVLVAAGAPPDDAKRVADYLVMGNLTGHDSHGVNMLPAYINRMKKGVIKPGTKVEIEKETPSYALVNGNWNFGQIVADRVMDIAISKAESSGIALVSAINCNHAGRLGQYCTRAAGKGMIAIMVVNSPPSVAPWGGARRKLGTNPICIAIPRKEGNPILLDMATSVVANGKVSLMVGTGERVPEGWIIDSNGRPSTKPEDFEEGGAMLPFGTYKGFGLGLIVDILGGAFTGSGGCYEIPKDGINGVLTIVIRSDLFVSNNEFFSSVESIIKFVLDCPVQKGFKEIMLPGQPEYSSLGERSKKGFTMSNVLWKKMEKIASELGVPLPRVR